MQVEVDNLPNCITALRVALPPDRVAQERQNILRDYQGAAKLPGYRPGKAPKNLVEARYKKEIADELTRKLVSAATREAIAEKKLRVLSVGDVDQVELGLDDTLRFTAKVITAPEFELPPYQNLPVKLPPEEVTDAQVDRALDTLRHRMAEFTDIAGRGLEMDDFCVIDFAGRLDGQPVGEVRARRAQGTRRQGEFLDQARARRRSCPASARPSSARRRARPASSASTCPPMCPSRRSRARSSITPSRCASLKSQELPALDDAFAEKVTPGKTYAELRTARPREPARRAQADDRGGQAPPDHQPAHRRDRLRVCPPTSCAARPGAS